MNRISSLSKDQRAEAAGPVLRAVFNIFEAWGLSRSEQQTLLGVSNVGTYYNWKKNPDSATLSNDLLERTSYLLGIWKSLQILIPDNHLSDTWIRAVNHGACV